MTARSFRKTFHVMTFWSVFFTPLIFKIVFQMKKFIHAIVMIYRIWVIDTEFKLGFTSLVFCITYTIFVLAISASLIDGVLEQQ